MIQKSCFISLAYKANASFIVCQDFDGIEMLSYCASGSRHWLQCCRSAFQAGRCGRLVGVGGEWRHCHAYFMECNAHSETGF